MGLLERYKKSGGFVQLLTLLETCTPQKRDKFLAMIKEENSAWEDALRPRILTVDRIFMWSPVALTEIVTRLQALTIAALYSAFDEARRNQMNGILNFNQHKQVKQYVAEKKFTAADFNIGLEKFLVETRGLINQGVIKLDKVDPELEVPDDIEEQLNAHNPIKSFSTNGLSASPAPPKDAPVKSNVIPLCKIPEVSYDSEVHVVSSSLNDIDRKPIRQESTNDKELQSEVLRLKERVQLLTHENLTLKNENDILKDKIERIRKIA
jgi:hypothetical protein